MKTIDKITVSVLGLLLMFSCQEADTLVPTTGNDISGITIMLPDGTKSDFTVAPDANNMIKLEMDGSIKTDLTKVRMSVNAPNNAIVESSIPLGQYMDFTKPVSFDVIAANGDKKTYTVDLKVVPTAIQVDELWRKTGSQLNFVKHNNGGLAISGDYLVIHERTKFDYYNLKDGTKSGTLSMEGVDWNTLTRTVPLFIANDDAGNIVSTNFYMNRWMPKDGTSTIHMFWWEGVNAKPKLLFSYDVNLDEFAGNKDVGRKFYVKGNIKEHAFLYMGVSFQNVFLRWEIKNGKPVSQQPEKIQYDPGYQMGLMPQIVPIELGENSNYFISRYEEGKPKVAITYMDGHTNKPLYSSSHHVQGIFHQWLGGGTAFDYVDLMGAKYMFYIEGDVNNWMREIYNVRLVMKDPAGTTTNTQLLAHTRKWNGWLEFPIDPAYGSNGNTTADVVTQIAPDKKSVIVAFLYTNSGVMVWKVSLM